MRRQDFYFHLPEELIAQEPLPRRSGSRLLVLKQDATEPEDRHFRDLPDLLQPGDLLVFNDTRVIPARLFGTKETGGRVEILLERVLDEQRALVQLRASKAPRAGSHILLEDNTTRLQVAGREADLFQVQVEGSRSITEVLETVGHIPLPPYIQRPDGAADQTRYQTVYARNPGAVAAPTAGLHFDEALLGELWERNIETAYLTLHVGAGTFQPVRVDDIATHRMHSELATVNDVTCTAIRAAKARGGRVVAVGTTVVRTLETACRDGGLRPFSGETDIFIYPGFQFGCIDALITNFHLPESTLLMLVSAFAGTERVLAAYRHAVAGRYRFFSYGDAMFLERHPAAPG